MKNNLNFKYLFKFRVMLIEKKNCSPKFKESNHKLFNYKSLIKNPCHDRPIGYSIICAT